MITNVLAEQYGRTGSDSEQETLIVALGQEHGFHTLLRVVIDELGYQCYADEIHAGTVQQIGRLHPAAIVLDVDVGRERLSWAVIQALREFPATADVPIIACAAASWLLDEHRTFLDHNDVLTWSEPFDIAQLFRALDAALKAPCSDKLQAAWWSRDR